ncbi:MAG: response regulator [Planctomycetaceae bacterium]
MSADTSRLKYEGLTGREKPDRDERAERSSGSAPSEQPINILIVDDEPKNLTVLESLLENPDYRLVRAESADQALMALIAEDFALLILDIQMPGMNGFELAQMVKLRKRTASIPIIFLTAHYSEQEHVLEGYQTGAVDYLHKPINPVILRSKVSVFAELHRKTRECSVVNHALLAEVAERRRAQEELSHMAQELEQRVLQRTAQLMKVNTALRTSEERFQLALKNSRILVYTTDRDLRYTWISDPGASRFSIPILGRRDDELVPPEQAQPLMELKKRVLDSGIGAREVLSFKIDGRRFDYDLTVEALVNEQGERIGVTVAAMEITDLKDAEAALKEADRRKDEFLATLAHELRNPLAPIRNAIQILNLEGAGPEEWEHAKDIIDRQSRQMTRLVDDLLDVSRIQTGKLVLQFETIRLDDVVRGAIETCGPLIKQFGHTLNVSIPPEEILLKGDLTRLSQVFSNLLNNSAKYTERGGAISLIAERAGAEVCISVKDNGMGIPQEMLPDVFEMFTQVDRHLHRSQGGLGIGLRLVKRLVELHGGSVQAISAGTDAGSEFLVRLPLLQNTSSNGDPLPPGTGLRAMNNSNASSQKLRILVVDDNRDSVESLRLLLTFLGHDVRVAYDGLEGISVAEEFRPEMILLDIGMPKLDGYETCRRIRSYDWGRQIAIIAQTGWGQQDDRRRTQSAGFDHHLVKPVNHATLNELLERVASRES